MPTETDVLKAKSGGGNWLGNPNYRIIWSLEISTFASWAVVVVVTLKRRRECFGSSLSTASVANTAINSASTGRASNEFMKNIAKAVTDNKKHP